MLNHIYIESDLSESVKYNPRKNQKISNKSHQLSTNGLSHKEFTLLKPGSQVLCRLITIAS